MIAFHTLQEQLAVKDAETAAAVAYTARLEQDVQRLTATAASMQAELDGATTEPGLWDVHICRENLDMVLLPTHTLCIVHCLTIMHSVLICICVFA